MTNDEVIALAKKAGFFRTKITGAWERFAALVAEHEREQCAAEIERLRAEVERLRDLCARLKMEAQIQAGEARTANATIAQIYQVVSGATGEPGNWHGAEPVRTEIERLRAENLALLRKGHVIAMRLMQSDLVLDDAERSALYAFVDRDAFLAVLQEDER